MWNWWEFLVVYVVSKSWNIVFQDLLAARVACLPVSRPQVRRVEGQRGAGLRFGYLEGLREAPGFNIWRVKIRIVPPGHPKSPLKWTKMGAINGTMGFDPQPCLCKPHLPKTHVYNGMPLQEKWHAFFFGIGEVKDIAAQTAERPIQAMIV